MIRIKGMALIHVRIIQMRPGNAITEFIQDGLKDRTLRVSGTGCSWIYSSFLQSLTSKHAI